MDALEQYKKAEDLEQKKIRIEKAMQREYEANKERHQVKMIGRIVKYAI